MGLETRNGKPYYYKKVRKGNRVVSLYLASGEAALQLAAEESTKRRLRSKASSAAAALPDMKWLDEYSKAVDLAVKEALKAAGYHRHHRGEWRKRR